MRHDLDLGADVLARRREAAAAEPAEAAERAERARRAARPRPASAAEAAADVRLERDVLADVDLGLDVVGREDVRRREDVGVAARARARWSTTPNAGIEMPVPRRFCEPGMPGPRTPSARPWRIGRVGQADRVERVDAAEDERRRPAADVGRARRRGSRRRAWSSASTREVHDDRLDEDLAARLIELVDDGAERGVVAQRRGDDDRVGGLVGGDLDAALEDCRCRPAPRPARRGVAPARPAPRAPRAVPRISLSVFASSSAVRVLERQDVDLALARLRDVEALDELEDAQVRALGRDDDERVGAIVGDDLARRAARRRRRRPRRRASPASPAPPPPALDVEELVDARRRSRSPMA